MRQTVPWSVKGVDHDAREAAKEAARRSGMSLGEWLNSAIVEQAAEAVHQSLDSDLASVTRRLDSISQRLDVATRRESETAIPAAALVRQERGDIVRALDAVARLAEISERRSAAAIEAVERLGAPQARPVPPPAPPPAALSERAERAAQLDAIARSIRSLDNDPQPAAVRHPAPAPRALRHDIDQTVAEIAARQKALAAGRAEAPVASPAAAVIDGGALERTMAPIAARLDALSQMIEATLGRPQRPAAQAAEPAALAGEIGRLSARIEALAKPSGDGIEREIKTLSGRIEQMRREIADREASRYDHAVDDLRADIVAIGDQLGELAPRRAVETLAVEIHALSGRLEGMRSHDASAEPIRELVQEFEQTVARLMPAEGIADELKALAFRVDALADGGVSGGQLDRLIADTSAIRAKLADTVSHAAVEALADQIAALSRRVDDLAAPRAAQADVEGITAAIEARIGEIADRLAAGARPIHAAPANPQLEEALRRLTDKLEEGHARAHDQGALAEIERHILALAAKIDAADGRFAQLGTIERGLSDLFVQMEEMRTSAIDAAERTARGVVADVPARGDGEIDALRREIAEIKLAREEMDRETAGTVGAVQQTLERVARRIAEIDTSHAAPAPVPAVAPPLRVPAQAPEPSAQAPAPNVSAADARRPARMPQAAERAAAPAARQAAPGREPDSLDLPLEPGSGAPRVRPPAPGTAAAGSKTDFIAAARRAAKAAASEPAPAAEAETSAKAGFLAKLRGVRTSAERPEPAALPAGEPAPAKTRWRMRVAASAASAPEVLPPEPVGAATEGEGAEGGTKAVVGINRKTILLGIAAALLVLSAGIVTMPKIRSLVGAASVQQAAVPAVASPPAAAPAGAAPAADFSPASSSSTPVDLTPPQPSSADTDPAPAMPAATPATETAVPETTGSVPASRPVPPAGTTVSPAGWQPIDTRTGRPAAVPATLKAAADAGDPLAAFEMGARHLEGRGVAASPTEAAKWFQRAADAGIAPAQYRLGSLYEKGTGVLRDYERARRLYERAGEAGNAKAMHNLAVMHAQGQVSQRPDYRTAAQWFRRAAEHGIADSQYNLGILYARGLGVDQSLAESYKWFALSAASGDQEAAKKRDEVAARLDAQTLVAARLAVQTFAPKPEPDMAVRVATPAEWGEPPAPASQPARPAPRRAQSAR